MFARNKSQIDRLSSPKIGVVLRAIHAAAAAPETNQSAVPRLLRLAAGDQPALSDPVRLGALKAAIHIAPRSREIIEMCADIVRVGEQPGNFRPLAGPYAGKMFLDCFSVLFAFGPTSLWALKQLHRSPYSPFASDVDSFINLGRILKRLERMEPADSEDARLISGIVRRVPEDFKFPLLLMGLSLSGVRSSLIPELKKMLINPPSPESAYYLLQRIKPYPDWIGVIGRELREILLKVPEEFGPELMQVLPQLGPLSLEDFGRILEGRGGVKIKTLVLKTVASMKDEAAPLLPQLKALVTSDNSRLAVTAIRAIGCMKKAREDAVDVLTLALLSDDYALRSAAREVLKDMHIDEERQEEFPADQRSMHFLNMRLPRVAAA